MVSVIWRGDVLVNNFLLYFTTDLFNSFILKKLNPFTVFHHIFINVILLISKYTNMINNKIIDISWIFEVSSIPLALYHMGYISKPIYNILFSYSFILMRLIYYNYTMYKAYLINRGLFTNTVIGFYILLNIMNCGIAWKMKLVQKLFAIRPAIEYFRSEKLKLK